MSKVYPMAELADLLPKEGVESATKLGLSLSADLRPEAWSRLVAGVAQASGRVAGSRATLTIWLGDLLAYSGGRYKGQIKEYAQAAGLEAGTLRVAKLVCGRIPVFSRLNTLSWAHHCEVGTAFKEPGEINRWLATAAEEGYSAGELRRRIREHVAASAPAAPSSDAATTFFSVMRELRAVERFLGNHPKIATRWSPDTCRQALGEIEDLAQFVHGLERRAGVRTRPAGE